MRAQQHHLREGAASGECGSGWGRRTGEGSVRLTRGAGLSAGERGVKRRGAGRAGEASRRCGAGGSTRPRAWALACAGWAVERVRGPCGRVSGSGRQAALQAGWSGRRQALGGFEAGLCWMVGLGVSGSG